MDALDIISWTAYSVYIVFWYAGKALAVLRPIVEPIADMFEHAGAIINPVVTYLSSLTIPLNIWINFLLWLYLITWYLHLWHDYIQKVNKLLYIIVSPIALGLVLGSFGAGLAVWLITLFLSKRDYLLFEIPGRRIRSFKRECCSIRYVIRIRDVGAYFVNAGGLVVPLVILISVADKIFFRSEIQFLFIAYFLLAIPVILIASRYEKGRGISMDPFVIAALSALFGAGVAGFFELERYPTIFAFAVLGSVIGCDVIKLVWGEARYGLSAGSVGGAGVFDGIIAGAVYGLVFYYVWSLGGFYMGTIALAMICYIFWRYTFAFFATSTIFLVWAFAAGYLPLSMLILPLMLVSVGLYLTLKVLSTTSES